MLNQVIVIGRLIETPILEYNQNERKVSIVTLAVPRYFKNDEGLYDTDFIKCILYGTIAETTAEYYNKGDLLGIKGRLECLDGNLRIIAEKVTFLATNKNNKEEK